MSPRDPSLALLQHRFLMFTGKGGVGKSTVVAAVAVQAAAQGMTPLIVELGHRASMRSIFEVQEVDFRPRDVGHGVHAMSIDFDMAVLDYMVQHIPARRVARAIIKNKVLERLFRSMPAVGEIATINKLRALEAEEVEGGRRWSPIVIDLDATGHALMFLELRNVLQGLMGTGPMLNLIESTAQLFADPQRSRLSLVTTPHELPVTETIELHQRLEVQGSVAFGRVFVNRVPMLRLPPDAEPMLDTVLRAAEAAGDAETASDVAFARLELAEATRARAQIERLAQRVDMPIVELPRLPTTKLSFDELLHIGGLAVASGVDR